MQVLTIQKKLLFWFALAFITLLFAEAAAYIGLAVLENGIAGKRLAYQPADSLSDNHREILSRLLIEEPGYTEYSADLGWAVKANAESAMHHPRGRSEYRYKSNSQGIRAESDYSELPDPSRTRIATFGDSFTHGDEVGNGDTWQSQIMRLDDRLEVMNFGVGGFGLDQAFLRYRRDATRFNPDIVFIGFMPENIRRTVNVFRPFYHPESNTPLTKPRFTLHDDDLVLVPNPMARKSDYESLLQNPKSVLREIGQNDDIYRIRYKSGPFDFLATVRLAKLIKEKFSRRYFGDGIIEDGVYVTSSDAFRITVRIFDSFYAEAQENGSVPVIVILPSRKDVRFFLESGKRRYQPLIDDLQTKGYRYIDLLATLVEGGLGEGYKFEELFTGHYSPTANRIVACALVEYVGNLDGAGRVSSCGTE